MVRRILAILVFVGLSVVFVHGNRDACKSPSVRSFNQTADEVLKADGWSDRWELIINKLKKSI